MFPISEPFCSIQVFSWVYEGHPSSGGQSAPLTLLIQMLIQKCSHRHTQNNVGPNIWAPWSPVKLTHKINHLRILFLLNGSRKIKSFSVLPSISFNMSYFSFQIIIKKGQSIPLYKPKYQTAKWDSCLCFV